ncbi:hypothetical protein LSH36_238g03074 [Paralvinella palmiformis]|uniref:Origin recognition complex subunit 3 n=1 Tax=Paralvinella palmiformis TaxID=53620 RepID=A0AAD9JLN5_9ANNE|nr:hypothetical protein LSH36_238g03074 [Paralvinella palmiformis]
MVSNLWKGVFVFKGKKRRAKLEDYLDAEDGLNNRLQTCEELLERIQEKFQLMQSELNTKLFEEVIHYVTGAHEDFSLEPSPVANSKYCEIPTAALVTGVNTPDHDGIFSNLVSMIHKQLISNIAVLKSKDCPTLKAIMNTTISQIMDNVDMFSDEEDEDEAVSVINHRVCSTMPVLASWYREKCRVKQQSPRKRKADGSPKKTSKHTSTKSHVIVVFEDLESFIPSVLQDFITICSHYLQDIPFVFIFGIATAVTAVHRLLPQHVSSLLCMEKFQAPPSSDCLAQVIHQIVMPADFPFKLGGRVFHLLVDMFLYHDFSVLKFIQSFQFALLDHFYSDPVSIMTVPETDLKSQVRKLSLSQLDHLRSLPSFRRFVEKQPAAAQIKLLEDTKYTTNCVTEQLEALYDYSNCVQPILSCIHSFVHKLPGHPLGHKMREIYGLLLNQNICDTPEYKEAMQMLRALSKDEMIGKLDQCIIFIIRSTSADLLTDVRDELEHFKDKYDNIEKLMQQEETKEELGKKSSPEKRTSFGGKMDLFQLKQTLQELDKSKKKKLTVYEVIRQDTIDYLDAIFRRYLISPTVLPLHEVMYYNRVSAIKPCINGVPRSNLENGLTNPGYYLLREDLISDALTILPTLPDVCIAYKLHNECGRLINLYDWLQAFMMIVKSAEVDENEPEIRKPDKLIQARFIRAVSELQFLGFIKPTKRKTDHVARLTWGAC